MDYNGGNGNPRGCYLREPFPGREDIPQHRKFKPQPQHAIRNYRYPISDQIQPLSPSQGSNESSADFGNLAFRQTKPNSNPYVPTVTAWDLLSPPQTQSPSPSGWRQPQQVAWSNSAPPPYLSQAPLPIAVSQMSKGRGVPFRRMYSPMLQDYGISEREFVDFVDTLNVVSSASPPFKVLDLAGGFVGMVPHHWAQLASNVMQLAAKGGTAIVSKSRTDALLSEANQNLFGSRRLRVRLVTSEALLATIGFPREKAITLPLNANVPLDQQPAFHTRLMEGLRGYVSNTVPTSLPSITERGNMLDKLSADQVSRDIKKIDVKIMKESKKRMGKKMKHEDNRHSTNGFETDKAPHVHTRSRSLERKIKKINKEADKKLDSGRRSPAQIEEERVEALSHVLNKSERRLDREAKKHHEAKSDVHYHDKHAKKNDDDKFVEKLLWIFIDELPRNSV